jgi:uncharacterized protein (DUF305 family)
MKRTVIAAALLLATLPSCSTPAASHNAADVTFLQKMIPHHQQGVEMAVIAEKRAVRPEIKALAAAIRTTQADEAASMTAWLTEWDEPSAAPAHDEWSHLHQTRPSDIGELRGAGADFEILFLNLLIGHQHNGVEMARTEVRTGRDPRTVDLARRIEKSRTEQITQMLRWAAETGAPAA